MENPRRWDALSAAAAILFLVPAVATDLHLGLPSGPASWPWLLWLVVSALVLGSPQIVMLAYVRASRSRGLRVFYLSASVALLGLFFFYLTNNDEGLRQVLRDQAAVGMFSISVVLALLSAAFGGIILWARRPFFKNPGFVLLSAWAVSFLSNCAATGGDPFNLLFLIFGTTAVWLAWLVVMFAWRTLRKRSS